MRSTRNRENGRQKQKSNYEDKVEEEELPQSTNNEMKEQVQSPPFSRKASGDTKQVSSNKLTSSEGTVASVQLLEQQKKRIEQLEKDLDSARVEIEKLRLYNRQLALSLTSLHRRGLEGSRHENDISPLQQSALSCAQGNAEPVCSPLDAYNVVGNSFNNDKVATRTCSSSSPDHQETWETTSKLEKKTQSRYWTAEEHMRFLEGLARFGHKDMKAIARFVGTRNSTQVRTHAQKYYLKLAREAAKRQEQQHNQLMSGFGNDPSEERRGCMSAPVTPSCRMAIGKRNMIYDDNIPSTEGFKSARLENRSLSPNMELNQMSLDNTKRMNWFSNSTVFPAVSRDKDSSGGEWSTTSEGNSETRNVSNDFIPNRHSGAGTSELLSERDAFYADLYQEKQDRETNCSFLNMSLIEGKPGIDSQFDSFELHNRSSSLTELGELHDEHLAEFEHFPKFHSVPDKSFGNLSSSGNSLMEFDDSHEVALAVVESEHSSIVE